MRVFAEEKRCSTQAKERVAKGEGIPQTQSNSEGGPRKSKRGKLRKKSPSRTFLRGKEKAFLEGEKS